MSKWIVTAVFVFCLSGCSLVRSQSLYEVRLTSGERLYAQNKPELQEDFYEFKDVNNQKYVIGRASVLYVEPAKFVR